MPNSIKDLLSEGEWSNNACLGYLISALESLNYSEDKIQTIADETRSCFNTFTVEEAKDIYCSSRY